MWQFVQLGSCLKAAPPVLESLTMLSPKIGNRVAQRSLQRRWGSLALSGVSLLVLGFQLFYRVWETAFALRWLALAALSLAVLLRFLWRNLALNHRPADKTLLPAFGWGTLLSLLRLLSLVFLSGFLLIPLPPGWLAWLPVMLNLVANFSDFLDGYLARITNHVTRLGQKLDLDLDGLGLLVATFLAYRYGKVPWWFLSVGVTRYVFLFGLWWRERQNLPIFELSPSWARRAFAGVQMGFATAMLVPVFSPPETTVAATLFMLPFLSNFLADWWQVSGRIELANTWRTIWSRAWRRLSHWGAFGLRILAVGLLFARWIVNPLSLLFTSIELLIAASLLLGAAGRLAAMLLLLETGFRLALIAPGVLDWMLIVGGTALLFLGSGAYSIWRPEESWIRHRAGERHST